MRIPVEATTQHDESGHLDRSRQATLGFIFVSFREHRYNAHTKNEHKVLLPQYLSPTDFVAVHQVQKNLYKKTN